MSPNATDSSAAILREKRKIPNGCANGWSTVSDSAKKQCWKSQAFLKVNDIVGLVKHYVLRTYIIFWRKWNHSYTHSPSHTHTLASPFFYVCRGKKKKWKRFADELSMNPRVRSSPFSPPPADELILSRDDVFSIRRRRLFFLAIHSMALGGLYLCVTGQVKLYTVLFGECIIVRILRY